MAMHGTDDWLRQVCQPFDDASLKGMLPRILHGADGTQVVSGGETSAVASQNDTTYRRGGRLDAFDMRQQLFENFRVEAIELFGLVEAERRQTVALTENHFIGVHAFDPVGRQDKIVRAAH
jgi:hypothetical protein